MIDIYKIENELYSKGYKYIVGLDEAGRGPMAGPVVVAAVILPKGLKIEGINDSKKLSKKIRESLYDIIIKNALDYSIEVIEVPEVDKLNVYNASKVGMERCLRKLEINYDYVLTDAIKLDIKTNNDNIIKGDLHSASIAAASIIAKVTRDKIMEELGKEYPEYKFEQHKGYVTKLHLELINKHGITKHHRRTFEPVQRIIYKQISLSNVND